MSEARPWLRAARLGAAALLGIGLVVPAVTACSSSGGEETEQVEVDSGDEETGDLEEDDPEPDIEE